MTAHDHKVRTYKKWNGLLFTQWQSLLYLWGPLLWRYPQSSSAIRLKDRAGPWFRMSKSTFVLWPGTRRGADNTWRDRDTQTKIITASPLVLRSIKVKLYESENPQTQRWKVRYFTSSWKWSTNSSLCVYIAFHHCWWSSSNNYFCPHRGSRASCKQNSPCLFSHPADVEQQ